jgi:hypothetical protein
LQAKAAKLLLFDQLGWIVRYTLGTAMIPRESQERPVHINPNGCMGTKPVFCKEGIVKND